MAKKYEDSSKIIPDDVYTSLFLYVDCQEVSSELMGWSEIKMKQDFGPLKKDQEYPSIWFEPEKGLCSIQNDEGSIIESFKYKLTAI